MRTGPTLDTLFGGRPHPLEPRMAAWLASSRRFAEFVAAFDTKIRKKLRGARDVESARDLELELETAWLLLRERTLRLEYEPKTGGRGPDFAVALTTRTEFMVEVARLRPDPPESSAGGAPGGAAPPPPDFDPRLDGRFAGIVSRKLGQLAPRAGNLLLVGIDTPAPPPDHLHAAMLHLQRRAEGDDPGLVRRPGFRDRSDFFRHYRRLSAVLLRGIPLEAGAVEGAPAILWINPQAERPLPNEVRAALVRSHRS